MHTQALSSSWVSEYSISNSVASKRSLFSLFKCQVQSVAIHFDAHGPRQVPTTEDFHAVGVQQRSNQRLGLLTSRATYYLAGKQVRRPFYSSFEKQSRRKEIALSIPPCLWRLILQQSLLVSI